MGGTGNLLARFYYGTVLFYGAEVNRHRIVQEKRYLVIGQKFSNGMVYHYAMGYSCCLLKVARFHQV